MSQSRREFMASSAAGLMAAAAASTTGCGRSGQSPTAGGTAPALPAGSPPVFGAAPPAGPPVTAETVAEAARLTRVEFDAAECAQAAGNWRQAMAPLYERRTGPRTVTLPSEVAPATTWNPVAAASPRPGTPPPGPPAGGGGHAGTNQPDGHGERSRFARSSMSPGTLPARDEDIAFAPVTSLSRWIESRALSSERLTRLYLERLERFQPRLNCTITLTRDLALAQARQADAEIAAGRYRGPLHGIPWGAKDLLDTAGIPTTYGAEPYRSRVPSADAAVVARLREAGAVLVAKLSLGALALNDVWFGGQTMNPWVPEEGSGGSSAGPAAATAAGCVAFAIGSETGGSIVGPSMRCGVTGLRPTYGRVARTGAMTLCWSLDKLGPMTRGVEDALLVLASIGGPDAGDVSSVAAGLDFDAAAPVRGLRVGYFPKWMREAPATSVDRSALDAVRGLGMTPVEVSLPDWPYSSLNVVLFAEAAAAFEELTLSRGVRSLKMQVPDAWPNTFRQARFLSAVDFVQADRLRRRVAGEMARIFGQVDLLLVPSLRDEILTITNFTGHPSLTLRAGFIAVDQARSDWAPDPAHPLPTFTPPRRVPHGITLIGRLFDEGTIGRVGVALEKAFGVADERPAGF
jgi:Asp-tRNA(Asn)/Glu-tRNA(Gln) amidotransferase A subunit family amidase